MSKPDVRVQKSWRVAIRPVLAEVTNNAAFWHYWIRSHLGFVSELRLVADHKIKSETKKDY